MSAIAEKDALSLVDRYHAWLRDRTTLRQLPQATEITVPFLDRHNDYIQIYIQSDGQGFRLTDDGHTIGDLAMSGIDLGSQRRQAILQATLNGFGVHRDGEALVTRATQANFPARKHALVQAILAVNDLFQAAAPRADNLFLEDVLEWLDVLGVRYLERVKFTGASGFDHVFDFGIPKSRKQPERLIRIMAAPRRSAAESFAFAWHDTKGTRPEGGKALAVVNDNETAVTPAIRDALSAYGVDTLPWSERDRLKDSVAA